MSNRINSNTNNSSNTNVSNRLVPEVGIRITREQYEVFERLCPNTMLSANSSETDASFKLGVAHTLQLLRHAIYK